MLRGSKIWYAFLELEPSEWVTLFEQPGFLVKVLGIWKRWNNVKMNCLLLYVSYPLDYGYFLVTVLLDCDIVTTF